MPPSPRAAKTILTTCLSSEIDTETSADAGADIHPDPDKDPDPDSLTLETCPPSTLSLYALTLLCRLGTPLTSGDYYTVFDCLPLDLHTPFLEQRDDGDDNGGSQTGQTNVTSPIPPSAPLGSSVSALDLFLISSLPTVPATSDFFLRTFTGHLSSGSYLQAVQVLSELEVAEEGMEDWPMVAADVGELKEGIR